MGIAQLQQTLASHPLICVDTMIWIYLLDEHPQYVDLAAAVFALIEQGSSQGVTSTLTLAELLTAPARAGDTQALQDYELYVTNFPNLQLLPPNVAIARQTALVRAGTGLKTPDAIQIATAIHAGASALVSNDKRWRNKINRPVLVLLDDYL